MDSPPSIAVHFGTPGDPLLVAVDDAWFEGDAPLDNHLALRSRDGQSLSELVRVIQRSKIERSADSEYLLLLAQTCDRYRLRLVLCNFEHAEANFMARYNRPEVGAIFDVGYGKRDPSFGTKLIVRMLRGESPKGEPLFVTGAPGRVSADAIANVHDTRWHVINRVSPVVAKGSPELAPQLTQFAASFSSRAAKRRYQFWARPGDKFWHVVFDWEAPVATEIEVIPSYLALFAARPNENIHPLWLDMINAAGSTEKKRPTTPKALRLLIVTEYLRRKVGNLSEPPTVTDGAELDGLDLAGASDDDHDLLAAHSYDLPLTGEDDYMRRQNASSVLFGSGAHVEGARQAISASESHRWKDIVREYASQANREQNLRKRAALKTAVAELRQRIARNARRVARDKQANLIERVQVAYRRCKEYYAEFDNPLRQRQAGVAKLAQHFADPKTLPGGVRGYIDYVYRPDPTMTWTTLPLE